MNAPHKILIITYYWPPSGGVGVQRWMNYAIQLKKRGFDPIILTPENPQFEVKDESLIKRVSEIPVHRIPIWEPFDLFHKLTGNRNRKNVQQGLVLEKSKRSWIDKLMVWIRGNVFIPDPRVFWVKPASKMAIKLIEEEGIQTLVTTGPPHSMHLIGRRVKKATGIKWIADFRDPWSKWDVLEKLKTGTVAKWIHRRMERSVLKEADRCITVSPRLAKSLGGIEVLYNGVTMDEPRQMQPDPSKFTIGYFGMLNELRNPRQLWQLLDQMCRENQEFSRKLSIRIGGIVAESIKEEISQMRELKDKITYLGYLPHQAVKTEYTKCNVLLLLLNKSPNSQWILPIKFFEYLEAGRMILALGDRDSDLGDLMRGKDVGELLSYSAIEEIRSFISDIFESQKNPSEEDRKALIHTFSHKKLTDKLEALITEL